MVEQANGVVAIMTDYNNINIVEDKGIMVVVMALNDSNRTAVAAEDFVGDIIIIIIY